MTDNVDNEANIAIWPAGGSESVVVVVLEVLTKREECTTARM